MRLARLIAWVTVGAAVTVGCSPAARYEFLRILFDGVPAPGRAEKLEGDVALGGRKEARRAAVYGQHGPYVARLCNACHQSAARNALVAPREELCFRCHEFRTQGKYVHGPLASGGCRVCHDPHGSRYRYLLVSEGDRFCLDCHERRSVAAIAGHANVVEGCTVCHDAHMSEHEYLLR